MSEKFIPNGFRLYGIYEAAEFLGISGPSVSIAYRTWTKSNPFVQPYQQLRRGPIWTESQMFEQLYIWQNNPYGKRDARNRAVERLAEIEALKGLKQIRGHAYALVAARAALKKLELGYGFNDYTESEEP